MPPWRVRPNCTITILFAASSGVELDGECGIAYAQSSYTLTAIVRGVSDPVSYTGKSLSILQKQEDGSWQFVIYIYNSDAPM